MLTVMAFLCAVSLSHVDCTRETAVDVMVLGTTDSAVYCDIGAQMTLAQMAIRPGPGERWIIKCVSTNIGNPVG